MFNSSARRQAIEKFQEAEKRYESVRKSVERASVRLFKQRQHATGEVIQYVEDYVNLLANSPKEFDKSVAQYRIEANRFGKTVERLETEGIESTRVAGTAGVAGGAAAVGVATLGPTAAMAVATTFGTASTGTAISALSGVAASNAALAWLGGGAITAGGGGMVAGKALLALAGPVGWTIGGLSMIGSGIYLNKRNKETAEKATRECVKVEAKVLSFKAANREIKGLQKSTKTHSEGCLGILDWLTNHTPRNYLQFDLEQKERLAALINHIRSLSRLLKTEVAL